VNGRLSEAQVLAAYINQAHPPQLGVRRLAAAALLLPADERRLEPDDPSGNTFILTPRIERFVIRDVFAQGFYPFSRFTRVEMARISPISVRRSSKQDYLVDGFGNVLGVADPVTENGASVSYYGPQIALVHDNSLFGWVGPFAGSRWTARGLPSFGAWKFTSGLVDWRRYFFARPFTLALRGVFFGRFGRDADLFQQFLGARTCSVAIPPDP